VSIPSVSCLLSSRPLSVQFASANRSCERLDRQAVDRLLIHTLSVVCELHNRQQVSEQDCDTGTGLDATFSLEGEKGSRSHILVHSRTGLGAKRPSRHSPRLSIYPVKIYCKPWAHERRSTWLLLSEKRECVGNHVLSPSLFTLLPLFSLVRQVIR